MSRQDTVPEGLATDAVQAARAVLSEQQREWVAEAVRALRQREERAAQREE